MKNFYNIMSSIFLLLLTIIILGVFSKSISYIGNTNSGKSMEEDFKIPVVNSANLEPDRDEKYPELCASKTIESFTNGAFTVNTVIVYFKETSTTEMNLKTLSEINNQFGFDLMATPVSIDNFIGEAYKLSVPRGQEFGYACNIEMENYTNVDKVLGEPYTF